MPNGGSPPAPVAPIDRAGGPRGPTTVTSSVPYSLPTVANSYSVVPGTLAAIFRGPGVITQIKLVANAVADVGFYIAGVIGGSGVSLLSSATAGVLTGWNFQNGLGGGAFPYNLNAVYPTQEVINNGNGTLFFGPGSTNFIPTVVNEYATGAGSVVAGQQYSFQNSFANGYIGIGSYIVSGPPGVGNVANLSYTYFAPTPFMDEVRVYLTPFTLWADQNNGSNHYVLGQPQVSITVNATLG